MCAMTLSSVAEDVRVDSLEKPRLVQVRVKESKTDRLRRGAIVALGWTGTDLCPVRAVLAFMVQRKAGPGPFFQDKDGEALTRAASGEESIEQSRDGQPPHFRSQL